MKPLPPAPETEEDASIWNKVARAFSDQYGSTAKAWNILGWHLQESDRRDAELMLAWHGQARFAVTLSVAMEDPANWKTVLCRLPDGSYVETS